MKGIDRGDQENYLPFLQVLYISNKNMKLTDTQTAQLAGAIADMFENGADYICYETAEIANTEEGEPVLVRRTFQIGIREIFKGKEA